jgi:DNA (cytosine-5)-methyltransferase 1
MLRAIGLPYVIENVVGAPLVSPITLCGTMFDLKTSDTDGRPLVLKRHRLFESNMLLLQPACRCREYKQLGAKVGGVYGGGSSDRNHAEQVRRGGYTPAGQVRRELMGIEWTTINELSQAIPPAYTEFIGRQLLDFLGAALEGEGAG